MKYIWLPITQIFKEKMKRFLFELLFESVEIYIARREGNEVKREYLQEIFKLQLTLQRCTFALQCNKTLN